MANVDNARIWTTATIHIAPYGTTAPTTRVSALDAAFEDVGIVTQDEGITRSSSNSETQHFAYGDLLIRSTYQKSVDQFVAILMEDTDLLFHLANPGSTSSTTAGETTRTAGSYNYGAAIRAVVFELTDGDIESRLYMPRVQFKQTGGGTFSDNAITGREFTGTLLAANIDGTPRRFREWTNDPGAAVPV